MKNKKILDLCKKKLKEMNCLTLLVPESIEQLAQKYPRIICNQITESVANAILNKDALMLSININFGGMVNDLIRQFFKNDVKKGETILIHHYKNKTWFTSVVEFNYFFQEVIVYNMKHVPILSDNLNGIEASNIISVTKVPKGKKVSQRYVIDNDHKIFIKILNNFPI